MNSRERVLAHLDGRPVDHLPFMAITMQFAARRLGVSYRDYATNYRHLVAGQIQVAEAFGLDHVNTMSDPVCEAADCGAKTVSPDDSPACIDAAHPLLADKGSLARLNVPSPYAGRMMNRLSALSLYRERVAGAKLIEGWIEGPCAEGAALRGLSQLMLDFYDDPPFVADLFEFAVQMELSFAAAQVQAGAECIGIGDAAASLIGPQRYEEFVWPYEKRMVDGVRSLGARVRLHICGNTRPILGRIAALGCDIVDIDYPVPMEEARSQLGPDQVLAGNLDPVRLVQNGTPNEVEAAVGKCHAAAGDRYIVCAGCEVPRDTPPENLAAMRHYAGMHQPANPN
ncbi:MAG: uroporphyrinogen decarboxylase family protein [Armatimonadetes bacterium]|nr:uroporphyrinogen decarboxylase family protein [Armatimonadota bacterium]MDE2206586.1 uroporphyrinogen decarboxylase family protein [Armatimonadota bacterium]